MLTYLERPNLSFIQQPTFELQTSNQRLYDVLLSVCYGTYKTDTNEHGNPFDFSGKRVRVYQDLRSEALAAFLAKDSYVEFLNRQVRESKDWLLGFQCNYLLLMRKYMAFLEAEQQGDSLSMEAGVVEYQPYWSVTKK